MAIYHPTGTLPALLDREAFGHWLSGFTDGEGCFMLEAHIRPNPLGRRYVQPRAAFQITLRADDAAILDLIGAYFGAGTYRLVTKNPKGQSDNRKPSVFFHIKRVDVLAKTVIPHFERFPLRAKKRKDFAVWKQGVLLMHAVSQRPKVGPPGIGRFAAKWTAEELQQIEALANALKQGRLYQDPCL